MRTASGEPMMLAVEKAANRGNGGGQGRQRRWEREVMERQRARTSPSPSPSPSRSQDILIGAERDLEQQRASQEYSGARQTGEAESTRLQRQSQDLDRAAAGDAKRSAGSRLGR